MIHNFLLLVVALFVFQASHPVHANQCAQSVAALSELKIISADAEQARTREKNDTTSVSVLLKELERFTERDILDIKWHQFSRAYQLHKTWKAGEQENTLELLLYMRWLETLKDQLVSWTPGSIGSEVVNREFSKEVINEYMRLGMVDVVISKLRDPFMEFQSAFRQFEVLEKLLVQMRSHQESLARDSAAELRQEVENAVQQAQSKMNSLVEVMAKNYADFKDFSEFLAEASTSPDFVRPLAGITEGLEMARATARDPKQEALDDYHEVAKKIERTLGISVYRIWFDRLPEVERTVSDEEAKAFLTKRHDRFSRDLMIGILKYKINAQRKWIRRYVLQNVVGIVTKRLEAVVNRFPSSLQNLYYRFQGKTRDLKLFEKYKGLLLMALKPNIDPEAKINLVRRFLQNYGGTHKEFAIVFSKYPDEAGNFNQMLLYLRNEAKKAAQEQGAEDLYVYNDYKKDYEEAFANRNGQSLNLTALGWSGQVVYWTEFITLMTLSYKFAPDLYEGASGLYNSLYGQLIKMISSQPDALGLTLPL